MKAQTATEYLIILAVVIIISLIVVGVIGGIPGIGGSTASNANSAYWATADIGIIGIKASLASENSITFRNNLKEDIYISQVAIGTQVIKNDKSKNTTLRPGGTYLLEGHTFSLDTGDEILDVDYTWAFKDCLPPKVDPAVGYLTLTTPFPGTADGTTIALASSGDTFEQTVTIEYVVISTGAKYTFVSEEKLSGTCAT